MPEQELIKIAENSNMIVAGYSFSQKGDAVSILNLNHPTRAMRISCDGKMLETNMDEIEQALVLSYWKKNQAFMEAADA